MNARMYCTAMLILTVALSASVWAAEMGVPSEVAPKAEGTRSQLLASAAWCEGSKSWLVAWREGYLNEESSDIWCARIAEDGRALDPAGVRLTGGAGLKSRPSVASDGKGFLVVWEDFRNGRDWDVYGAVVPASGNPADKNGFLLAGGEHNQMRPAAAFAGSGYQVAWMGFAKGYGVYGLHLPGDGRPAGGTAPLPLALSSGSDHILTPALGLSTGAVVLAAVQTTVQYCRSGLTVKFLDPLTGAPVGSEQVPKGQLQPSAPSVLMGEGVRSPTIAVGRAGSLVVISDTPGNGKPPRMKVLSLDPAGRVGASSELYLTTDRQGVAFNGENYMVVADSGDKTKGWIVGSDGKLGTEFLVSEGSDKPCISPAIAAGTGGSMLVVYSEVRGVDSTRLVARIVK